MVSSKPPTPNNSHRGKQQAWRTPPRTTERHSKIGPQERSDTFSPPPSGPISPREYSLSHGHNALTDLRRVETDTRRSNDRLASSHKSEKSSAELAARLNSSAVINNGFSRETRSNFRQSDVDASRSSSRIPLTGDEETDANILAFIKARDSILQEQNGKLFAFTYDTVLI